MRTFVIGDIHGAAKALEQCLERAEFNIEKDTLISLGDICDAWPYVKECVDILLSFKNRVDIKGNHDEWFERWLMTGYHPDGLGQWVQGGSATARSYLRPLNKEHLIQRKFSGYLTALNPGDIPEDHVRFFRNQILYYERGKQFFVHAGFDRMRLIEDQQHDNWMNFYWDRNLWKQARSCKGDQKLTTADDFEEIFIGHTSCEEIDGARPVYAGGVWNLDTGAGWYGKLTIMDVDTKKYWQSDRISMLYPNETGRG